MVDIRNKDYGNKNPLVGKATDQPTSSISATLDPFANVVSIELTIKPTKGVIPKSTFNLCVRVAKNYNITEDLTQPLLLCKFSRFCRIFLPIRDIYLLQFEALIL